MSLIYYNYWKRESRFHAFHSYQAMTSQLPVSFLNYGFLAWVIVLIVRAVKAMDAGAEFEVLWGYFTTPLIVVSFWVVIALNLLYIILSLVAYKKASQGRFFYLPLFGRISYNRFFGPHAVTFKEKTGKEGANLPPGSAGRRS